jgi:hypothetical protein
MVHFLLKSIVPARDQVNDTDQLLLRVVETDIVQDRRRCIRNTERRPDRRQRRRLLGRIATVGQAA